MAVRVPPPHRASVQGSETRTAAIENGGIAGPVWPLEPGQEGSLHVYNTWAYRTIREGYYEHIIVSDNPPQGLPPPHSCSVPGPTPAPAAPPSPQQQPPRQLLLPPSPLYGRERSDHHHVCSGDVAPDPPPAHQMAPGAYPGYPPVNGILPYGLPPLPHTPTIDDRCTPYVPLAQPPMYGEVPSKGMLSIKRKPMRATLACEECRKRKQKCDEDLPCSSCNEKGLACEYREKQPPKTDQSMSKLLGRLEEHSQGLAELITRLDTFEERVRRVDEIDQWSSYPPTPSVAMSDFSFVDDHELPKLKSQLEDHRTAPHELLLLWPTMRPLLESASIEQNDGYVMEAEDRGVPRLWTRDEGIDEYDGTRGQGFPSTPSSKADLDQNTINRLYDSYMRHIHILHPFLDKRCLRNMFDAFIKRYCTEQRHVSFAVDRTSTIERSPTNAIIYLVLALGEICLHCYPLPASQADRQLRQNSTCAHHTSDDGRLSNSPGIASITKWQKSSDGASPMRWRSSSRPDMNEVPGLAYYAMAAQILGEQGDGNELVHAQMFLLAGLYKGQIACVKESMSWITMASRAILMLLDRYKLYNEHYWGEHCEVRRHNGSRSRTKETSHSLIVLSSWTCLQLESDILAELWLPSSSIRSVENLLPVPQKDEPYRGVASEGWQEDDDNILIHYTAQLFLRRCLNQVQREMTGAEPETIKKFLGHENFLRMWRQRLPPSLRWSDEDQPSCDILAARLRANYYGARYLINRPFLDYALHIMPSLKQGRSIEEIATDGYGNLRDEADIHIFRAIEKEGEHVVWQAARHCIDAALHGVVAFDGIPDRLVVTNIHGTAHAQFGMMLVLCATFTSRIAKHIVDADKFQGRLRRTIEFLGRLAPISPTCEEDGVILKKLQSVLFPTTSEPFGAYQSMGTPLVSRDFTSQIP